MKITPHRAFGYVVYKNTWELGEAHQYNYPEGRMWWNLFTAGSMINNTFSDGSSLPDYQAGDWIGPQDMGPHGICNQTPVDNPECWCVPAEANNDYLPGSMTLNGKTINNPTQIKVSTAEATVVASEQCYGINFL